jgi:biofilm PGA synthesis lipoprotein PgaB
MNHQLPVRADVWSAVASKLHHAGMKVWIRAPVLNLSWVWQRHPEWRIVRDRKLRPRHEPWYFRVSPDLPEVRAAALDFYADLAVYLPIDGVLFDDDAYLLPNEALRESGSTDAAAKARALREMLEDIRHTVRAWRPHAQFGRNLYAGVVEHEGLHPLFTQDLVEVLRDGDLAVVMAYAHMEGHGEDAASWVGALVERGLGRGTVGGPAPLLFKLQAYDWAGRRWIEPDELERQALAARRAGAVHLGVYPIFPVDGTLPAGLLSAK